jgi:two-component system sensor histidine kinase UhpB
MPMPAKCASACNAVARGLRLLVRDNGQGTALPLRPGIGLRSMRERSRSLGGELRLHSRPQAGWALCLNIPLEATR